MLTDIKGVGEKTLDILNKLGIYTEKDLLNNLPKTYLNLSIVTPLELALDGSFCLLDVIILEKNTTITKGKLKVFKVCARYKDIPINLVWYNQNYVYKKLEVGTKYTIYGKLKIFNCCYEFVNPFFEEKTENSKFKGIQPIYITKGIINQRTYWNIVKEALNYTIDSIIPKEIEEKYKLMDINEAYSCVHTPKEIDTKTAKERILLESIIRRMAGIKLTKLTNNNTYKYQYTKKFDIENYKYILPFELNISQINALNRLSDNIISQSNLNAILCGDVGSGKTIVAMLLSLFVVDNGYQVAIMAPTEILARQHYDNLCNLCKDMNVKIAFMSSAIKGLAKKDIICKLETGEINIVIGTHSVLNKDVHFDKLGFVVIDEQHRFGVGQRTKLLDKGKNVDILTLSATPIPRSLQLAYYGDIDYVTIDKRYENNITTAIVPPSKRDGMWNYLYAECIEKKSQAYIVAPKIVDVEGIEKESVEELHRELLNLFPSDRIAILHGKLSCEKKQKIINDFYQNKISLLISTTVVEVGIDVPNAKFMVIMDSDNFGLASLHQLRGRVGRDGTDAYCFLYTTKEPDEGLIMMTNTSNGSEIAEKDFEMRGSGDILGLTQSGSASLQGITLKNIKLAKEITDELDLFSCKEQLKLEIESFSLINVSLT
jgi:ATP-dependent DNA helicase RecG